MNDYFIDYNPRFPIFAIRVVKGLAIHRVSDHARLAVIPIRNIALVANYNWDVSTGKFLSIFFKDGTIRIHDIFKDGRLVSFLRIPRTNISRGIWDRIPLKYESGHRSFAYNVIDVLPKLIRFVKDSKRVTIAPYTPPNSLWRGPDEDDPENREKLDIHVIFNEGNDKITVFFNGDYAILLPVSDFENEKILKSVVKVQDGFYHCLYNDGTVSTLNLERLLQSEPSVDLLRYMMVIKELIGYLLAHIEFINRELTTPYVDFLKRICDEAYGYSKLKSELECLFLLGEVPCDLDDWLCNAVGEKNFKRWKVLGCEAYQKTVQVFTLAFVPTCERIIIFVQKVKGVLEAFSIQDESDNNADLTAVELLLKQSQELLNITLKSIIDLGKDEALFEKFLMWFNDRIHEGLDEDYKSKFEFEDDPYFGYDLLNFFEKFLFGGNTDSSSVIDMNLYRDLINSMTDMEKDIAKNNVNPHIQRQILFQSKADVFSQRYPSSQINLLDAIKLPKQNYIVYLLQVTEKKNTQEAPMEANTQKLYIGTLKDESLNIVSRESSIKIPEPFKSYDLNSARFAPKMVPNFIREIEQINSNYNYNHNAKFGEEEDDDEEDDGTITIPTYITESEKSEDFIACTTKISVDGRSASLVFPKGNEVNKNINR
ncbi:anaphase promoting complex subunit 4 [Saccharomyces eubayanus]|uniref:anaphase promoting complex subunit 4 n=1 Tax=Saccharomyces eubayanus TaxID=1080349 RepID=UPI0006C5312E|nr:APC4-like protein [Saccharomyces eubayanus]KOH00965.1 APC4-like protein [Saccharomyces eubayanus]